MIVECAWCHISETLEDDMVGFQGMFFHSPTCLDAYRDWRARRDEESDDGGVDRPVVRAPGSAADA